jgi:hypothetical protein
MNQCQVTGPQAWKYDDSNSRRPGFVPGSVHVGYMVTNVALGQVFPRLLRFSSANNIRQWLSILISGGPTTGLLEVAVQTQSHPTDIEQQHKV